MTKSHRYPPKQHPYFGMLNFDKKNDKVIWKRERVVAGQKVVVSLITPYPKIISQAILDALAYHCENMDKLHESALVHLTQHLEQDDEFMTQYVIFGDDYDLPELESLVKSGLTAAGFAQLLKITAVNMYIDTALNDNTQAVTTIDFDYMIDPEQSYQILMVKFDLAGQFKHISWES